MSETAYTVRKCGLNDLEALVRMRLEFLKEAGRIKTEEEERLMYKELVEVIKLRIDKDLYMWLAEVENKAVATGAVCIWDKLPSRLGNANNSKIGYVLNMYTSPEYRKRGIANSILQNIRQFLNDEGIPNMLLHALEAGKRVYRSFGFSVNESAMEMKI